MVIIIGSDHAGYSLKEKIKLHINVTDVTSKLNLEDDYPDIAKIVGELVVKKKTKGILICGTGIGMSIAANKIKGVRAALCHNSGEAKLAREHNNANILCLGGRITSKDSAFAIINTFLSTEFLGNKTEGKRHKKRVKKIKDLEN